MRFPTMGIVATGGMVLLSGCGGSSDAVTPPINPSEEVVASIIVTPTALTLNVGSRQQLVAATFTSSGTPLYNQTVNWLSSNGAVATISSQGMVTVVGAGVDTIRAVSGSVTGSLVLNVAAPVVCTADKVPALAVGEVVTLSSAQRQMLCLGNASESTEYAVIMFNAALDARSVLYWSASNTTTIANNASPSALTSAASVLSNANDAANEPHVQSDYAFRERERATLRAVSIPPSTIAARTRGVRYGAMSGPPAEGSIVILNSNLVGNSCTNPSSTHPARVVKVLKNTILYVDTLAPRGGYTDAELIAQATLFDTLSYPLDTATFGAPFDIDNNGRVGIFFTQGINELMNGDSGANGIIAGLFAARDLIPTSVCTGSNYGEMFYLPVLDVNREINPLYSSKAFLASATATTLVHELQHLINGSQRANAQRGIDVAWMQEGLSSIAEEMLYYKLSGRHARERIAPPFSAFDDSVFNNGMNFLFKKLTPALASATSYSPFTLATTSAADYATRAITWQFLRYAGDRKGGDERETWRALAQSTLTGTDNINAVFGDAVSYARDFDIAQLVDGLITGVPTKYVHASWDYRAFWSTGYLAGAYPLQVRGMSGTSIAELTNPAAAGYFRFGVAPSTIATIKTPPLGSLSAPEVMIVRTR